MDEIKEELVSVIIPVYNAEKYLEKCIESIINQTYKKMEIICVNDGSTDNTGEMLQWYRKKDDRIIVVCQENRGESNARNVGLKLAKGEYIAFVDCDDWIEPDMYKKLVRLLEDSEADIAIGGWYLENANTSRKVLNQNEVQQRMFGRELFLDYLYQRDVYRAFAYMWNKLYKRQIVMKKGEGIWFDENIRLGGDVIFLAQVALRINKAIYTDEAFYHYRQREKSGSHTDDLSKMLEWVQAYARIIEMFKEDQVKKETIDYVKRFLVYHSSNAVEKAVDQENIQMKEVFQNYMRQYEKEYLELNKEYSDRIDRFKRLKEC